MKLFSKRMRERFYSFISHEVSQFFDECHWSKSIIAVNLAQKLTMQNADELDLHSHVSVGKICVQYNKNNYLK